MEDAGEGLSASLSPRFGNGGSDDDRSALATCGLPFAAGPPIVAGTTLGGLLPIFAAITSPTLAVAVAVAGHALGAGSRLGGGGNGYCSWIK